MRSALNAERDLRDATVPERRPGDADDKLAISTSAKEEEETILRELKEALKGVDSDKAPGDPQTDRPTSSALEEIARGECGGNPGACGDHRF